MPETEEVVVNTGPLIALIAGLGDLSVLKALYRRVLVPFEVCREMECGGASGFGIHECRRSDFIEKRPDPLNIAPFLQNTLDLGEASVIQLALDEKIHTVCIDESLGRRIARLNGLKLTGSIGILIRGKKQGFEFSMRKTIDRMQSQGVYLSQKVIRFALSQVAEE